MNNFRIYLYSFIISLLISIINILHYVYHYVNHGYINTYLNIEEKNEVRKAENTQSKYFPFIRKNMNCKNVYIRMMNRRQASNWPPPKIPPQNLYNSFTQNGEMPITQTYYFAQNYSGSNVLSTKWTLSLIEEKIKNHKSHKQIGGYGEERFIDEAITKYSVTDKDVAVIGSVNPWVEAIIASKNPKSITTIEYRKINSTISYLKTYTPNKFADETLKEEIKFDFVVSYSSIQHFGLGRYGDELDPDGDIHAAEEVWCMLKDGGFFLIGLPYAKKSFIRWNADRNYGPERMKYFAANFEQVEFFGKPWFTRHPLLLQKK